MADLEEILRKNPMAAAGVEGARDAVDAVRKLRAAGVAGGPKITVPIGGRKSFEDLKGLQRRVNVHPKGQ